MTQDERNYTMIWTPQGVSTIKRKKWSSVASRRQCERCDVTYALLPTVAKFRWFVFRCCGSHRNFATVGNNTYVTSQHSRCLRDATDDHFLSLIVDSPSRMRNEWVRTAYRNVADLSGRVHNRRKTPVKRTYRIHIRCKTAGSSRQNLRLHTPIVDSPSWTCGRRI